MKKIGVLFSILACATLALSQEETTEKKPNPYDINYEVKTDQEAHYTNGDQELYMYIFENVNYSQASKDAEVDGHVMVSFRVETDGSITNLALVSGVGHGVDEEVVRLLGEKSFEPAVQNGTKTPSTLVMSFPVQAH